MPLNFNKAEFVRSAGEPKDFLRDGLPQFAFAGRSNVGKSSVINRLVGRKNLAYVGASPGKTTHINYFLIDQKAYLVDLPGYGYAKVSRSEKERWARLMETYFQREADAITTGVLIVDIRHKPTANDLVMHDWFRQTGCPEIVVANKLDKLKKSQVEPALALIRETLERNDMHDGVHIRLMVSRGLKSTPNQDPRFLRGKATIVIVAEHKVVDKAAKAQGLTLFTSTFRWSGPDVFDLRLNSHSLLNFILSLIHAINAGANEALMLDPHGFVASCNSTNFFIVRDGELWTSTGRYNFNGITHKTVMRLAREAGIVVRELDFTLAQTYTADEAFVTGTLGGLTPVYRLDGHAIVNRRDASLMQRLAALYDDYLRG